MPVIMENPREINWTDSSDSKSEVHLDEIIDRENAENPRSPPRRRIAHDPVFSVNADRTEEYRRYWRDCLICSFIDTRKFTTRRVQALITSFWHLCGEARVVGGTDSNFIVHFSNAEDRLFIQREGPWSLQGGLLYCAPWEPNIVLTDYKLAEISIWV